MEHLRGVLASLLAVALGLTLLMPAAARSASCCCALMAAKSCPLQKAKRDCGSGHSTCSVGAERDANHRVATSPAVSASILTNRVELRQPSLTTTILESPALSSISRTSPPDSPPPRA
jgi:hypothetical protein